MQLSFNSDPAEGQRQPSSSSIAVVIMRVIAAVGDDDAATQCATQRNSQQSECDDSFHVIAFPFYV